MKRSTLLWVGLFAGLVSLTGCISGPDLKGQPFFTSPAEPRADEATVYFYRTTASIGSGVAPTIQVDGRTIGSLPSGSFSRPAFPPASTASPPPRHRSSAVWLTSVSISPSRMARCITSLINSALLTTRMGRPWVKSTAVVSAEQCFTRATRLCLPRKRCVLSSGARSCRQPHGNHASNIIPSQLADREQPHTTAALWGC